MKVFATSKSRNGISRTAMFYSLLLMAVAISKATNVMAKSNCTSLNTKKKACRADPGCHWILHRFALKNPELDELEECYRNKLVRCVHVMTDLQCSVYNDHEEPKHACRAHGCKWHKQENQCIGRNHYNLDNDRIDKIGPLHPDFRNSVDKEFLEELIGEDAEEAMNEIQVEYPEYSVEGNRFVVAICSTEHYHVGGSQCVTKDFNSNRIKLIVDGDNIVLEIIIG